MIRLKKYNKLKSNKINKIIKDLNLFIYINPLRFSLLQFKTVIIKECVNFDIIKDTTLGVYIYYFLKI